MENESLWESMKEWLKDKNNSSIYFTFIFATITWNWKFFYALFFVSTDSLRGITSIEYALSVGHFLFLPIQISHIPFIDLFILHVLNLLFFFFVPALVTFLMLWYLPHLNVLAHRKGLTFYFQRKSEFDLQKSRYLRSKNEEAGKQIKTLEDIDAKSKRKVEIERSIKSKLSPEEILESEFAEFVSVDTNIDALRKASEIIYKDGGYYQTDYSTQERFLKPEYISKLDVYGLISWAGSSSKIEFTDKGKYFLRHLK